MPATIFMSESDDKRMNDKCAVCIHHKGIRTIAMFDMIMTFSYFLDERSVLSTVHISNTISKLNAIKIGYQVKILEFFNHSFLAKGAIVGSPNIHKVVLTMAQGGGLVK